MKRRLLACVLSLSTLATFAACKEDEDRPAAAADGTGAGGGGGGGGGAGSEAGTTPDDAGTEAGVVACNALDVTGATVDQLSATDAAPVGIGGTLIDGTYDLSDARVYGATAAGPTGISYKGALVLDTIAGTMERVIVTAAQVGQPIEERSSLVYTASGTSIVAQVTCPAARPNEQLTYTASATTLVLTNVTTRESYTFTRR